MMETPLPIKDLILFRLYTGKPIFELEIFENFTEDLTFLLEEKMIIPLNIYNLIILMTLSLPKGV